MVEFRFFIFRRLGDLRKILIFSVIIELCCGCKKTNYNLDLSSHEYSNGPLKQLNSKRAEVSGQLVALSGSACKVPLSFETPQVEGCNVDSFCSAVIVRDRAISDSSFVLSAAHCFQYYFNSTNCKAEDKDRGSRHSELYFYSQALKKYFPLAFPTIHPEYLAWKNSKKSAFDATSANKYNDIGIAFFLVPEHSKSLKGATIETAIPRIIPSREILDKMENDIEYSYRSGVNDGLSHFVPSFSLDIFDSSPIAELLGGGVINSGVNHKISFVPLGHQECLSDSNFEWTPAGCVEKGRFETTNFGNQLRSVKMRLAYSSLGNALSVFIPRKEFPLEGSCFGDSGGPAFLGEDDSISVFAIESRGPRPCPGSPTVRTIVYSHISSLKQMLSHAVPFSQSCK